MKTIDFFAAPTSSQNKFRRARFGLFRGLVDKVLSNRSTCKIVDIGGSVGYWTAFGQDLLSDSRITIAIVNLSYSELQAKPDEFSNVEFIIGDACSLDKVENKSFDIAHSNSVIEHVGQWRQMRKMASEVRRVSRFHFVQTPYWGFPIEPHNRTAFFHWLPEQARYRIIMKYKRGFWSRAATVDEAMEMIQSNSLLDRAQFSSLFSSSSIYSEIVFGLTKSLIAVGGDDLQILPGSNTRNLRV